MATMTGNLTGFIENEEFKFDTFGYPTHLINFNYTIEFSVDIDEDSFSIEKVKIENIEDVTVTDIETEIEEKKYQLSDKEKDFLNTLIQKASENEIESVVNDYLLK